MTIMYKHILEMKRKSRFLFIDNFSIFMTIGASIIAYNFRTKGAPEISAYAILGITIYLQFFMTMMGKLRMELLKPYIYLIPEKSIKKVFAASATSLLKPCIDGVLVFMTFTFISGFNLLLGIFFALAYAASGAVFTGMTILYQRVLGGQPNKMVQIFIGMGFLFAIMAPSIGASVLAAFFLPDAIKFMSMLPYTLFCLMFAALLFITCGNLIDKAEYTGKL